jgi:hypothetical protein
MISFPYPLLLEKVSTSFFSMLIDPHKVEKERIFYFRCDKLEDYRELDEVLKTYFKFRKSKNITNSFIS